MAGHGEPCAVTTARDFRSGQRATTVALAALLLSPLVPAAGASAPLPLRQACLREGVAATPRDVPVLSVTVSAEKQSYRRGDVAVVPVHVRLALPDGPKVDSAHVKVVLSIRGRVVKELYGQTNASGLVRTTWNIGPKTPAGTVSALATASVLLVDSYDCSGGLLYETGRDATEPLAVIRA